MVFGGGEQTTQNTSEAEHQVIVTTATRNGAQVVQQDDERTQNEEGEHQDRDPTGTDFDVLRNWRGIASRCRHPVLVVSWGSGTGLAGASALRSRASACFPFRRCHERRVYALKCRAPTPTDRFCWQAMGVTRVLVLDSYDSFVYNLVQYLGELGAEPLVYRNDDLTLDEALALDVDGVLLSPGPGRPEDAGIICEAIVPFAEKGVPVFGVCLGHQAIGHVFGGQVIRAPQLMHGKTSEVNHRNVGVFTGVTNPVTATRYHSLVIEPSSMPDCLEVTASTSDGIVMGVRHKTMPVEGVQFHPESILTGSGHDMLRNFLHNCK